MVGIAQLVERWIVAPEAVGSNPSSHPCNDKFILTYYSTVLHLPPSSTL